MRQQYQDFEAKNQDFPGLEKEMVNQGKVPLEGQDQEDQKTLLDPEIKIACFPVKNC